MPKKNRQRRSNRSSRKQPGGLGTLPDTQTVSLVFSI
jgi:hypothetical protein